MTSICTLSLQSSCISEQQTSNNTERKQRTRLYVQFWGKMTINDINLWHYASSLCTVMTSRSAKSDDTVDRRPSRTRKRTSTRLFRALLSASATFNLNRRSELSFSAICLRLDSSSSFAFNIVGWQVINDKLFRNSTCHTSVSEDDSASSCRTTVRLLSVRRVLSSSENVVCSSSLKRLLWRSI